MVREAGDSDPPVPPSSTKLSFVTTYHLAVKNLKQILMEHWNLIRNQLLLKTGFQNFQSSLTIKVLCEQTRELTIDFLDYV